MADGAYLSMYCIRCGKGWTKNYEACPAFEMFVMIPYEKNK